MKTLILLCFLAFVAQVYCFGVSNVVGGFRDVDDLNSVAEYSPLVEKTINEKTNDDNYHKVVKITKARSQVVAGIKYDIDYTVTTTDCNKKDVLKGTKKASDCKETKTHACKAIIIVRLWENYIGVEGLKCADVNYGIF